MGNGECEALDLLLCDAFQLDMPGEGTVLTLRPLPAAAKAEQPVVAAPDLK